MREGQGKLKLETPGAISQRHLFVLMEKMTAGYLYVSTYIHSVATQLETLERQEGAILIAYIKQILKGIA